jgi:hypothetical protein
MARRPRGAQVERARGAHRRTYLGGHMIVELKRESVTVTLTRRVQTTHEDAAGKYVTAEHVPDGERTGVVVLVVDVEAVWRELARTALRNKGRKATAMSGAVRAMVMRGTESETHEEVRA